MWATREDLAMLRENISNKDYAAILVRSMPKSYDTYLSAITASLAIIGKPMDPDMIT